MKPENYKSKKDGTIIHVESLEIIPERESEIVSIKHRNVIWEWKVWNLTGLEFQQLQRDKDKRRNKLDAEKPKPPTRLEKNKDIPVLDDKKYLKDMAEFSDKELELGIWYEYRILEMGLFECNKWTTEGETEKSRIEYMQKKVGAFWLKLIGRILAISIVTDGDIQSF